MREKIYKTVHIYDGNLLSKLYKYFMIAVIAVSIIPLTSKQTPELFYATDLVCLVIYIIDFILRWITADYKFQKHNWTSFAKFPFRMISIIDLMSVFALLCPLLGWFKYSSITKILKVFRIIRIFKYSKGIRTILRILSNSQRALIAVGSLALGYIVISALLVFNAEPETFNSFFDAIYWATISLTTVGYGDFFPVSAAGKIIAMVSSFFGIAIVALPAGIITAGYMKSLNKDDP